MSPVVAESKKPFANRVEWKCRRAAKACSMQRLNLASSRRGTCVSRAFRSSPRRPAGPTGAIWRRTPRSCGTPCSNVPPRWAVRLPTRSSTRSLPAWRRALRRCTARDVPTRLCGNQPAAHHGTRGFGGRPHLLARRSAAPAPTRCARLGFGRRDRNGCVRIFDSTERRRTRRPRRAEQQPSSCPSHRRKIEVKTRKRTQKTAPRQCKNAVGEPSVGRVRERTRHQRSRSRKSFNVSSPATM